MVSLILTRSFIVELLLKIQYQIEKTKEIFLISRAISLWCIHYEATVTSLIT